jgi:MFS family permease
MALGVLVIAQIMILLDATVVNVALPSAQADLDFSDASRQWVITAYVLAFGSLLPLGGRLGDAFGRKMAPTTKTRATTDRKAGSPCPSWMARSQ